MSTPIIGDVVSSDAPIKEGYRQIEQPQSAQLQTLHALWQERPQDGFVVGRDIPSRRFAPLLSHILFWEPVDGGANFTLRLCGEALRLRFGDNAIGKLFTELVAPEVVPHFFKIGRMMLEDDHIACFEMDLVRNEPLSGRSQLHFELVIFPVWAHGRTERWILNGVHYFL